MDSPVLASRVRLRSRFVIYCAQSGMLYDEKYFNAFHRDKCGAVHTKGQKI